MVTRDIKATNRQQQYTHQCINYTRNSSLRHVRFINFKHTYTHIWRYLAQQA